MSKPANEMPACVECRRRKLRCSRETPTCKECRRLSVTCHYEAREAKPGMKTGAVENLNRRVDHLESMILQMQQQIHPITEAYNNPVQSRFGHRREGKSSAVAISHNDNQDNIAALIYNKYSGSSPGGSQQTDEDLPDSRIRTQKSGKYTAEVDVFTSENQRKRRHSTSAWSEHWGERILQFSHHTEVFDMTPQDCLESIVDTYFSQVHPWIPMIHQGEFRQHLITSSNESTIEVILHAMVVAAIRLFKIGSFRHEDPIVRVVKNSRNFVILNALNSLCVENLQALIIVAFDDIGSGNTERAWSIVGSLTRTVEYLQLSVESEEVAEQPLLQPCPSLPSAQSWNKVEERRRIFWNIFILDRFCSIITGWNTSLTSDDVRRCLPVDGVLWRRGEPVLTPYFGIWDKSAGRIGNSIAFFPTQYSSPGQTVDSMHPDQTKNTSVETGNGSAGMSTIGAFAYCIEATESMSRVTTYFLQQKVNLKDQKQIESWLTRFKELDLRLVHWKMFLPQKWKETKIKSQKSPHIMMDPNLTVAHVTHNASMILLHQLIAYPPSSWAWAAKLPSRCSADTCQAAAVEIANITQNYLASTTTTKIINSQFVFCIFIAARSLLIHWRYYSTLAPLSEFFGIIQNLDTISTRWQGQLTRHSSSHKNLAGKYAFRLRSLHETYTTDPKFRVNVLGYANDLIHEIGTDSLPQTGKALTSSTTINIDQMPSIRFQSKALRRGNSPVRHLQTPSSLFNQIETAAATLPLQHNPQFLDQTPLDCVNESISPLYTNRPADNAIMDDGATILSEYDLESISQLFFDQQYVDMDRVINFNDGMFSAQLEYGERFSL